MNENANLLQALNLTQKQEHEPPSTLPPLFKCQEFLKNQQSDLETGEESPNFIWIKKQIKDAIKVSIDSWEDKDFKKYLHSVNQTLSNLIEAEKDPHFMDVFLEQVGYKNAVKEGFINGSDSGEDQNSLKFTRVAKSLFSAKLLSASFSDDADEKNSNFQSPREINFNQNAISPPLSLSEKQQAHIASQHTMPTVSVKTMCSKWLEYENNRIVQFSFKNVMLPALVCFTLLTFVLYFISMYTDREHLKRCKQSALKMKNSFRSSIRGSVRSKSSSSDNQVAGSRGERFATFSDDEI